MNTNPNSNSVPFDFTPEQRQAVIASGGMPLHIHDPETEKVFLLIEQGVEPTLDEEYIHEGLQIARLQIERGEVSDRDINAVIVEAKHRYAENN